MRATANTASTSQWSGPG